jgi:hypothetical protein
MVFIPTDDGQWVSEEFERLACVIQDYDPALQLRWIPPMHRTREDKRPYIIVDTRTNTEVMYASELDTPAQILGKLFMADNKNGSVLDRIEAENRAQEALDMKMKMDIYEEAMEKAKFLIQKRKNYTVMGRDENNRLIKLDDQLRRIS